MRVISTSSDILDNHGGEGLRPDKSKLYRADQTLVLFIKKAA